MARYIADAAIEYLEKHKEIAKKNCSILCADEDSIIKFLQEKCPTADVVEVKHGYWEFKPSGHYSHVGSFCSVCGKKSGIGGIRENQLKPYCPNCGAKMDGERSSNE